MRNSKILAASLAGAMFVAASSSAFGAATFSLVPHDPPLSGIDCTKFTGVKNRGMIITVFKTDPFGQGLDASNSPHDDLTNSVILGLDFGDGTFEGDTVGDLWKFFPECSTPAG